MISRGERLNLIDSIDWKTLAIYVLLVFIGWVNIYATVYDESYSSIFDIGQRSGMQFVWMCICGVVGVVIMLVDVKYYHMFAYPLFVVSLLLLLAVLLVGKEVNGARSWLVIGPIAVQPTEFVKITASLAVARYMSVYGFSFKNISYLFGIAVILGLPFIIVILQNDTGSALVYSAFLLMFYREGFFGSVYVIGFCMILLFVGSFFLTPIWMVIFILFLCVLFESIVNGLWRLKLIYIAGVILLYFGVVFINHALLDGVVADYWVVCIALLLSMWMVGVYVHRYRLRSAIVFVLIFLASLFFVKSVDYGFNDIMKIHQQKRVLDLLGLENDVRGWGYNVNQSKIAIGSGGLFGKGFLEGTQTKYDFVPEQSTDFIFCTVGEEWGFVGSIIVLALFCGLILRLIKMGERMHEPFGRIYCYSVASIIFFHVFINIGMTIGIVPVIGIPLPFFSYGGSSLLAFSILFFIALKMDSAKKEL